MRINDALMQEVFRRAEVIREKQLQRRKLLMGLSCVVLSLALLFLLNGKTGMTVASYTESYGSLVFEGSGSHYVIIAVVFFFLAAWLALAPIGCTGNGIASASGAIRKSGLAMAGRPFPRYRARLPAQENHNVVRAWAAG